MANVIASRLSRLEDKFPEPVNNDRPRISRIVVTDEDIERAYREAAEKGVDTSPSSDDLMLIRLVPMKPKP